MPEEGLPESLWPGVSRMVGASWPPRNRNEAINVVLAAREERLLPLMFRVAASLPPTLQEALRDHVALKRIAETAALMLRSDLELFLQITGGEPFILLKGAAYAFSIYDDFAFRPMQDIDVLVPRDRLPYVIARMRGDGRLPYRANRTTSWSRSYPETIFTLDHTIVEVHQAVVQRARHSIDYDVVWAARTPVTALAPGGFCASPAHQLLLHCVALLKEEYRVALIHYLDLWFLSRRLKQIDDLAELAREWSIARAVGAAMRNLCDIFPEARDLPVVAELEPLTQEISGFVWRFVPESTGERKTSTLARKLVIKFGLMDRWTIRLRFAVSHLVAILKGGLGYILRRDPWAPSSN